MASRKPIAATASTGVIDAIYGAARSPDTWGAALGAIREDLNADMFTVVGFDPSGKVKFAIADSPSPGLEARFKEHSGPDFPILESAQKSTDGLIHFDPAHQTATAGDSYASWMKSQSFAYSAGGMIRDDECGNLFACAYWTRYGKAEIADGTARLEAIMPHLERGFQISRRLEQCDSHCNAIWGLVQDSPHGVMAVDATMQILRANHEAARIVGERDGLEQHTQRLLASESVVNAQLVDLVRKPPPAAASRVRGHGRQQSIVVRRPSNRLPIVMMVLPHTGSVADMACGPALTFLFLRDLARELDTSIATFGMAFSLTPAERKLVGSLAAGQTLNEHSEKEGVSEETSRWHLKNIFTKTHCRSQIQLMNLVRKSSMPRI